MSTFADRLVAWQKEHGRHGLPWQNTVDPYRVWVSEIMLQQTQVVKVKEYYARFMEKFPSVQVLAAASEESVLAAWAGLGYYSRARNLHHAAQAIVNIHGGIFPDTAEVLQTLKGIGRSTAAAIASFCFNERVPILDGNVKRVLARHAGIEGFVGEKCVEMHLWQEAEDRLPQHVEEMPFYTQGMMDLGATLCTRTKPMCMFCPVQSDCNAFINGTTDQIPWPRPSKKTPLKAVNVLLILCGDHILLEHRQRSGVWRGLWSLPELTPEQCSNELQLIQHLNHWSIAATHIAQKPSFRHIFSHYQLDIIPWHIDMISPVPPEIESFEWKKCLDLGMLGFPAPILRYLQESGLIN